MNQINIWDLNGQEVDVSKYGLLGQRLIIPSPSYEVTREKIPGRFGLISLGKDLSPRDIEAIFVVYPEDYDDYFLLRDELYELFSKGNAFYIGEKRQPGKRWFVKCTEQWTPERISPVTFTTTIPLLCETGMAESVGTTLDSFEWDADLWQYGMGLDYDGEYKYEHNTSTFTIYNAGNVEINPRNMDLKIEIQAITSNYIELINHTTNDIYRYNGSLTTNDKLLLDGIRSTKNSLSVFRDTNKKVITLVPGENLFEIKGAMVERILFYFRFYYL